MTRCVIECMDAIEFLHAQPDDSIDLLVTSPPYLEARTYGIAAGRKLEPWVEWMRCLVETAAPKVRGLIAINCEGQTRDYRYLPAPFLLMSDLHRAGFNLRKPVVFHRIGIPGSGGPDWLRNDWEPIVCLSRPGRLPWSDPTACGKPPKWKPGGAMSHRAVNGERTRESKLTVGAKRHRKREANGAVDQCREQAYLPPALANPGNVIRCVVGGGRLGHPLAHENEAPFPLDLASFFVQSFCPPGGVVCDPFLGSGTTAHAAVMHGRRFRGCDVRPGQCEIARRRVSEVTPDVFAGVT